jgi:DNA primase
MISDAELKQARASNLLSMLPQNSRLKRSGKGWKTTCPFHDDTNPSMSLFRSETDGTWFFKCHGCGVRGDPVQYIMKDKKMSFQDSVRLLAGTAKEAPVPPKPDAVYDYYDKAGVLIYQVCRYPDKQFRIRRPDEVGTGWIWDMCGVSRALYRLPGLLNRSKDEPIYYVEGEKDVETMERHGLAATTHAGGAGSFREELVAAISDRYLVVIPDRDDPGMQLMRRVFAAHRKNKGKVGFLLIPERDGKQDKDVSDWFERGGTWAELAKEIK